MKIKVLVAALAVAAGLAPAALMAGPGCSHDEKTAMSCPEGQTWNPESRSCVVVGA